MWFLKPYGQLRVDLINSCRIKRVLKIGNRNYNLYTPAEYGYERLSRLINTARQYAIHITVT
jgi:hypothetical protein